jgi:hypothetical protein
MPNEPKLTRVRRLDSVPIEKVEYTEEGYLIDNPIVTSVGIFDYKNSDGSVRRELRLPENVFAEESLASYEGKPVIITHNAGRVSKENVTEEIVGTILSKGIKDGDDVRAKIIIHDIDTVKRSGFRELSLGYNLILDETPGKWNGQPYDAIQTEITINHLAVVREARAGEQARLNIDSKTEQSIGGKSMANTKKKAMNADEMAKTVAAFEQRRKARLDGEEEPSAIPEKIIVEGIVKPQENATDGEGTISAEPSESEKKEITLEEKVQNVKERRDRRDQDGDPQDVDGAKGLIAQQDEDISTLFELLSKLQAAQDFGTVAPIGDSNSIAKADEGDSTEAKGDDKSMNADSVDAIISEKLKLARIGDRLNIDGLESVKPIEAKKRIAKAIKPTMNLDGKDTNYINAAFDLAMSEMNTHKGMDYQRKQMFNADSATNPQKVSGASAARERMKDKILNGGND